MSAQVESSQVQRAAGAEKNLLPFSHGRAATGHPPKCPSKRVWGVQITTEQRERKSGWKGVLVDIGHVVREARLAPPVCRDSVSQLWSSTVKTAAQSLFCRPAPCPEIVGVVVRGSVQHL